MYIFKRFFIVFFFFIGVFASFAQQNMDEILKNVDIKIPRLSPVPEEVKDVSTPVFSLNGTWQFNVQNQKMGSISVPGEWEMQGFKVSPGETGYYVKSFDIPKGWQENLTFIRFDGVSSQATVKINGQEVGKHEGGFVPFEFEITDALKPGDNKIMVEVKANTISDILACTSQYAAHTVGGILRKVTLFNLPDINISDIKVETKFDKRYRNADLIIKSKVENQGKEQWPSDVSLQYSLIDKNGKEIKRTQVNLQKPIEFNGNVTNIQRMQIRKPKHWNPEQPYLYTLKTEILKGEEVLQLNSQKVGFREVEVNKGQLLVNGTPIKLHGVNRHIVHPLTGRSITPKVAKLDAKLFKQANCNYIRTSHYPPSEEFLKAADSLGIFVESEAALTWIEHHASPIWEHWDYKDERFLPYFLMANIENIQAYKNHPSVIIWSLANESRWSPLWEKVKTVVDQLDETRPNSFHDQVWGGFNNAGSKADIANYHYPGINGPKATDTMSRLVLFGEYAHLSTYNRRELLTDPGVRDAYNVPLVNFYDSIYSHKNNLGGAIWSGIDDTFHLPDGKIVGYGPWGPLDGWRRPKPEYYGMKKAYSPIKVENKGVVNGKLQLQVEN
ncbi:hypothetical protein LZ575_09540 [Antarcticibacterium sp. 1MA-6-2]|uniref:glycoside hydrolase family 2 protein n=1 Tax=Antarcticibacterium sp. 1MA-6-2 TaxID=2908210 RepID=UPI001F1A11B9|nr:glycoside hydrolase family 2 TIM barrel-domain containing protein [Antarcticibacterium sp. 1MA-6-2]UJH92678.1 hypothetical protein LZ575_09540 [Antarcticibacterium sp. 1MA-6-2]